MSHFEFDVVRHLERLIAKLRWIERCDEERGLNPGRTAEHSAITWAVEELSAVYPAEFTEAEARIDRRNRHRAAPIASPIT